MANDRITEQLEMERRVAFERLEAAYFAIPEHDHKHLELTQSVYDGLVAEKAELLNQLAILKVGLDSANSATTKRKDQFIGFLYGCIASLVVTILWWQLTKHFSYFR